MHYYRFLFVAVAMACLGVGCSRTATTIQSSQPEQAIPETRTVAPINASEAIVRIRSEKGEWCGTGFVVETDSDNRRATIWTCGHVVGTDKRVIIDWQSQNRTGSGVVVRAKVEGQIDFAEVIAEYPGKNPPPVCSINTAGMAAGSTGFGLGHAGCTWMAGGPIRVRPESYRGGLIPFDPPFNKGASGGPIFDAHGDVTGIITYRTTVPGQSAYGLAGPVAQGLFELASIRDGELPDGIQRLGDAGE